MKITPWIVFKICQINNLSKTNVDGYLLELGFSLRSQLVSSFIGYRLNQDWMCMLLPLQQLEPYMWAQR